MIGQATKEDDSFFHLSMSVFFFVCIYYKDGEESVVKWRSHYFFTTEQEQAPSVSHLLRSLKY